MTDETRLESGYLRDEPMTTHIKTCKEANLLSSTATHELITLPLRVVSKVEAFKGGLKTILGRRKGLFRNTWQYLEKNV